MMPFPQSMKKAIYWYQHILMIINIFLSTKLEIFLNSSADFTLKEKKDIKTSVAFNSSPSNLRQQVVGVDAREAGKQGVSN